MIRLAIQANPYFSLSDVEIKRAGRSFTIDTIKEFKKIHPLDELYFIIGSDLLKYLDDWKDLEQVTKLVKFIAVTRPGYPLNEIPTHITTLAIRAVDISGYEIRRCLKDNRSFRYLVPSAVYSYINQNNLYR